MAADPSHVTFDLDEKQSLRLAIALHRRMARLLAAFAGGDLLIKSERIDLVYIAMRHSFFTLLQTVPCLADLRARGDFSCLPDSLHSCGEDWDVDWEYVKQQSVEDNMGALLGRCVELGVVPSEDVAIRDLVKGYDEAISQYKAEKGRVESAFWKSVEAGMAKYGKIGHWGQIVEEAAAASIQDERNESLTGDQPKASRTAGPGAGMGKPHNSASVLGSAGPDVEQDGFEEEPLKAEQVADPDFVAQIRIVLAAAIHRRLVRLLQVVYSDYTILVSEAIEWVYMTMRRGFLKALDDAPSLAQLRDDLDLGALPTSLFGSGGIVEWEAEWEFNIQPRLHENQAKIVNKCVELGVSPLDETFAIVYQAQYAQQIPCSGLGLRPVDGIAALVLKGYDEAIATLEEQKGETTKRFWKGAEANARQTSRSGAEASPPASDTVDGKAAAEPKQERSGGGGARRGPTTRTRERANLYKSLKDADRTLSYAQVAMATNKQERSDVHTEDTVRNILSRSI